MDAAAPELDLELLTDEIGGESAVLIELVTSV